MAGQGDVGQAYIEEIIDAANAGQTQGFTRADWQIIADNDGYETQRARAARLEAEAQQPSGGNDGGGDTYDPDAFAKAQAAEFERRRISNAVGVLQGVMNEYGLGDLMSQITTWVQDGLDGDAIMMKVRETDSYNRRFPAMKALRSKGRFIDEASYIEFERTAAQLERSYGLPAGMLDVGTVTRLLENEVSLRELEERVTLAAVGAYQTSNEIKQQFKDYYGIDQGGLTAYFLDPDKAMPLLNKQYASSVLGAEGQMQGIGVGREMAEELTNMGVSREEARAGFGRVRGQQGLMAGRGDVVNQDELIGANLMNQEDAQRNVERAATARIGRFQGGGGYQTQQTGVRALESSSGT